MRYKLHPKCIISYTRNALQITQETHYKFLIHLIYKCAITVTITDQRASEQQAAVLDADYASVCRKSLSKSAEGYPDD